MPQSSDITKLNLPLTLALSLFVSAVTGTVAAMGSAYSLRDSILTRLAGDIDKNTIQLRAERNDQLRQYVSKEAFGEWRQQERIRQDAQFYKLLNAIEQLGARR